MPTFQQALMALATHAILSKMPAHDFEKLVRRQLVVQSLITHKFNQCRVAQALGLHRNTLSRWLVELDIDVRLMKRPVVSVGVLRVHNFIAVVV